jgi:hypothetical protein
MPHFWKKLLTGYKVVDWFTETNSKLKEEYGKVIPSLAFYHIPAHAMLEHQQRRGVNPHLTPGVNRERVNPQGTGDWSYDGQDVKFMDALLHTEGLIAGFSGHDHQNDWYARLGNNHHLNDWKC